MDAKRMNECDGIYRINEKYQVIVPKTEYMVLVMGFGADKAAARFSHPNIAASRKVVHNFKHYRKCGSKFWTSHAGVDHYMVVPTNAITMLPEEGYSYVRVEINGVKIKLNVTGGTMNGWTDYVGECAQTSINHKLADLKKVLEVAVRSTPIINVKALLKDQDPQEVKEWETIVNTKDMRAKLIDMIIEGKRPKIALSWRYSYCGRQDGIGIDIDRCGRWKDNGNGGRTWMHTGAPRYVKMSFNEVATDDYTCRAKITQIDWIKSAELNGISALST